MEETMAHEPILDIDRIKQRLAACVKHYEQSAPAVSTWLDNLYIQIGDDWRRMALWQLRFLDQLYTEGQWMQANVAQNTLYHWLDEMDWSTSAILIDH